MDSIKGAHELQKGNLRAEQGPERKKNPRLFIINSLDYRCATLINRKSTLIQAPRSGHTGLGKSESYPTSGKMSAQ